ncbi:MAG TPA: hypothetical protein VKG92_01900 [Flavobacteriales bacterium]|nr:hypothetical protein [Flavobacteriales bacterium]
MKWKDRLQSTTTQWWALLTLAMVAFITSFYGHVLQAPNSVLFTGSGDGLKNYFTYAWHVDHDPGFLHFTGSGYPFGEHVFFTDGHPLLSWVLQVFSLLAPYKIGILNTGILLGLLVCAWCLFGVLRKLGIPPWAAAIGAFSITLLEPQLFRMTGHLSLSHCWMFPLTWYLLLRTRGAERRVLWTSLTAVVVLIAFLTHPYLGMMSTLFITGYYACLLLFRWRANGKSWRTYAEPLLMAALPMILFLLLLKSGDAAVDRPGAPPGADQYATRVMSLIMPTHPPFSTPLTEFFKYEALDWESWCYLGFSSLLMLVVVGAVQVKRWATPPKERGAGDDLGLFLGAGFLVLLFAMGYWQAWFAEWFPMLAQFRGTGRFAWIFYYTCGVFCTVRAYQYLFERGALQRAVGVAFFTVLIGFYAVEGWSYHEEVSASFGDTPNVFDPHALDEEMKALVEVTRTAGVSAIIPLPYVHVGSETYQKDATEKLLSIAYPLAFHSDIPLMAGITSRTSLENTRELLALLAPPSFPKEVSRSVPKEAMFLLVWSKEPLRADEQALWERGTPLMENGTASLRLITSKDLFACDQAVRSQEFQVGHGSMRRLDGSWLSTHDTLDPGSLFAQVRSLAVNTPITARVMEYTDLLEIAPGTLDTALTYEMSFVYHAVDRAVLNICLILENARADGSDGHWGVLHNLRSMPMQFADRTIATLTLKPAFDHRYKFILNGPYYLDDRVTVDHIVFRPLAVDVWREGSWNGVSTVFLNNVPLNPAAYRGASPSGN